MLFSSVGVRGDKGRTRRIDELLSPREWVLATFAYPRTGINVQDCGTCVAGCSAGRSSVGARGVSRDPLEDVGEVRGVGEPQPRGDGLELLDRVR